MSDPVAIVYGKPSEPFVEPIRELNDPDIYLFSTEKPPDPLPKVRAVYMRVGETLRFNACREGRRIQERFRSAGSKILNGLGHKYYSARKDIAYRILETRGIRVPWSLSFPTNNEVNYAIDDGLIRYPMLMRQVDALNAIGMRLIMGDDDLRQSLKELDKARDRYMVCEYLDATNRDGYHEKWRTYVFGGRVDMWEAGIARNWRVNLASNLDFAPADFVKANDPARWPEKWGAVCVEAARILGLDICAFDVIADARGEPVILDINDTYGSSADLIEKTKKVRLFSDEVRAIRAGHYARLVAWMRSL